MITIYGLDEERKSYDVCTDLIDCSQFNDGTPNISLAMENLCKYKELNFHWYFDSSAWADELFVIHCIMDELDGKIPVDLFMPYVPNARMDRHGSDPYRAFTLKTFAKIINSMGFRKVTVADPHSDVTTALIDRCETVSIEPCLEVVARICGDPVWALPDAGAMHKWGNKLKPLIFGEKMRNWDTGHIEGYILCPTDSFKDLKALEGRDVIIVDDIVAHGYTLYFMIMELMKYNPRSVKIFVTHLEDSFYNGKLYSEIVAGKIQAEIYTTNSIHRWQDDNKDYIDECAKFMHIMYTF